MTKQNAQPETKYPPRKHTSEAPQAHACPFSQAALRAGKGRLVGEQG